MPRGKYQRKQAAKEAKQREASRKALDEFIGEASEAELAVWLTRQTREIRKQHGLGEPDAERLEAYGWS